MGNLKKELDIIITTLKTNKMYFKLRHSYSPKITKADCNCYFIIIIFKVPVMVQLKFDNHICLGIIISKRL